MSKRLATHVTATLLASALAGPVSADPCHEPIVFLLPVVVSVGDGTDKKETIPFDNSANTTVTMSKAICESPFSTVENEEVTFTWKLRQATAKGMTFSIVGAKTVPVTSGQAVTLPAGQWVFRIERPAPKVGRIDVLTFGLTARFKGEAPVE